MAAALPAGEPNTLSAAESAAGWKLLWDGTAANKEAFLQSGTSGSANTWGVDGDALKDPNPDDPASRGSDAFLFTKEHYSDFEFSVEWRISPGGNSGIFPRQNGRSGYCATYEFGILDDFSSHGDADDRLKNPGETDLWAKRTAGVYDMYPTTENGVLPSAGGRQVSATKKAMEWNHGVIFANGNFVEHWLNGQKVVDFEIGSQEWLSRFARSKFPGEFGCRADLYGRAARGMIGFQDHGHDLRVWLRNLKIRTFNPGDKLPRPYIHPLHPADVVAGSATFRVTSAVAGATIRYTTDGSIPTADSPAFKDSLVVTRSTTLKAILTRPRFAASDVATGTFTAGPVSAAPEAGRHPRVEISRIPGGLRIGNPDGAAFRLEVLSLDGALAAVREVGPTTAAQELPDLKPGVYLVRLKAGGWRQSKLMPLP